MDAVASANLIKLDPAFAAARAKAQVLAQEQEQVQDSGLPLVPSSSSSSGNLPLASTVSNSQSTDQVPTGRDPNKIEENESGSVPKPDPKSEDVDTSIEEAFSVTTSETKPTVQVLPDVTTGEEDKEAKQVTSSSSTNQVQEIKVDLLRVRCQTQKRLLLC